MTDYRAIMTLVVKGRSYREIVDAVGCSHRDVSTARKTITDRGIDAQRLAEMSEAELTGLFPDGRGKVSAGYDLPDFKRVAGSMRSNRHFTLLQAWRGYVGSGSELRKYGYSQYCHLFGEFAARNDLVATLHHEPGRAMFVDWAGDTIPLVDAADGRTTPAYLFVAVLPFSGCVYCQAFIDMRMDAWIAAHVGAFCLFGGVPQILVPDNASTATHRKKRGEAARFVNERYRQMADHYGTAIVPARVKKPRDKAAVESAVNTVNKRVIGYLLEETWTTLSELNEAIAERVYEVNHDLRRADGTTRFELFAAEEASLLAPLPDEPFEQVEWKELKVGRNYHLTADYQHYSVPYALAGRVLRVRLTASKVTVFDGQQVAAEHRRKTGRKGQYSTDPGHVPPQHRNVDGLWSRRWFLDRAAAFGPATVAAVEQICDRHTIEAQGYLDCQNILETLGRKNKQKLEAACQQLANMRGYATYSTIKRLMAAIDSDEDKKAPVRAAASNRKNTATLGADAAGALVRGADYYRQGR
ncbi:MAG: IS21 family transposase [Candidatus Nanopelagicales bacterium]|nr:IS21 family transposase [Candidatus Nanopelagicales bacterium]